MFNVKEAQGDRSLYMDNTPKQFTYLKFVYATTKLRHKNNLLY